MTTLKKWLTLSVLAVPVLIAGLAVSQPSFAEKFTSSEKWDKLKKLKAQQDEEMKQLQSMPSTGARTQEEQTKADEHAQNIKDIGWEIGELNHELNPPDPRVALQKKIETYRDVLGTKYVYRGMADRPEHGATYKKAFEIVQQKEEKLAELERDFKENKKSVEQVAKELEDIQKIDEFPQ